MDAGLVEGGYEVVGNTEGGEAEVIVRGFGGVALTYGNGLGRQGFVTPFWGCVAALEATNTNGRSGEGRPCT